MNDANEISIALKHNLSKIVSVLAGDIGSRSHAETENLEKAACFIEDQFKSRGLVPERQTFNLKGNDYHNIFSEVEGTGASDEILVIGAHYDTVGGSPGADDNASGIAGMLELSRLIAKAPAPYTVKFAAFTLEEPPFFRTKHMGSFIFASSMYKKNIKVKGMISLEMIGYFNKEKGAQYYPFPAFRWFYPNVGDYIAFVGNLRSKSFTNKFVRIFKDVSSIPVESLNALSLIPGVDFSDHLSFWRFRYPAFMITDTAFYRNPYYHGPGDTADTLDYGKMSELVLGIYKTILKL
ncbi:MAG: M28 family peptidase [Nitrospirota bacterium]